MGRDIRILVTALLLSLGAHAWVVGLPGWGLPAAGPTTPAVLHAQVVSRPRPAAVAPAAPQPLAPQAPKRAAAAPPPQPQVPPVPAEPPAAPPVPDSEASAPDLLPAPEPAPPPTAAEALPEPEAVPGPAPALIWPHGGRIVYDVFRGDQDFLVGRTEHRWEHDGQHYRMESVVETTGVVALFRSFRYVQRSEGRITRRGLEPQRFSVEQAGKSDESADFDWLHQTVTLRRGKKTRVLPIRPGDQDVLSLWHQLVLTGDPPRHLGLTLVTTKAATPAELEQVGEEVVQLPLGRVAAHHLRARALDDSLILDIWLAEHYGYLPVRILMRDKKGESLDQRAREVTRETAPTPAATTESTPQ